MAHGQTGAGRHNHGSPRANVGDARLYFTLSALQTNSLSHTVDAVVLLADQALSHTVDAVIDAAPSGDFSRPLRGVTQAERKVPRSEIVKPLVTATPPGGGGAQAGTIWFWMGAGAAPPAYNHFRRPFRGVQQPTAQPKSSRVAPVAVTVTQTFQLTHTVDAVILVAGNTRSHTVDAVILTTTALNHTVDAVIWQPPLFAYRGEFQAPRVVLPSTIVGLPSQTTSARSHTVDAVIQTTSSVSHTVDAVITGVQPQFLPLQAEPKQTSIPRYLGSRTFLPPVAVSQVRTHTVDAVILVAGNTRTHTVDAVIQVPGNTRSHTVDAVIVTPDLFPHRGIFQPPRVVPSPAIVGLPSQTTSALSHTVDAVVLKTTGLTHTVDAVITGVQPQFLPYKAQPYKETQRPRYLGSRVIQPPSTTQQIRQHTVDVVILVAGNTRSHAVTAVILVAGNTRTHTVDAVVLKTASLTHTVDAVVTKTLSVSHTVDAIIAGVIPQFLPYKAIPKQTSIPRFLRSRVTYVPRTIFGTLTHTVTAVVQVAGNTRTHTVTAVVLKTQSLSHTVSAVVTAQFTRTHTVTAVISLSSTKQYTVTAMIHKDGITREHLVTAVIFKTLTRSHQVDAEIGQPYQTRTFQVDAYIYNPYPVWTQDDGIQWPQDGDNEPQWPQDDGSGWQTWYDQYGDTYFDIYGQTDGSGTQWPQDDSTGW